MNFDKVTVTGGSGLLGRFVVDELMGQCELSVLDIKAPRQEIPYRKTDILDLEAMSSALAGQDAVVHLAGIDEGNDFSDQQYFATNVLGTWNLLHAAQAAAVKKIVVASSTAVYGLGRGRMPDYLPVDEEHPQRPTSTYALSKQIIEVQCRSYAARAKLAIVCLRPTLIVRPEREAAILAQLDLDDPDSDPPPAPAASGGRVPYGALSVLRSYVRSRDAARAFRLALGYQGAAFEVFNLGAVDGIGHEDTLARVRRVYGRLPEIRDPRRYQANPFASVLASGRARERLGWEPRGDWDSISVEHRP